MVDEVTQPPPQPASELQPPEPEPEPEPASEPQPAGNRWARRRRTLLAVGWVVLAVMLVAAVVAGVHVATRDSAGGKSLRAKPGDCFAGESDSDLRRVPCDDRAVRWTVLGVVEHKTEKDAKQKACEDWPDAEASYWESRNDRDGFVLCLASVRVG